MTMAQPEPWELELEAYRAERDAVRGECSEEMFTDNEHSDSGSDNGLHSDDSEEIPIQSSRKRQNPTVKRSVLSVRNSRAGPEVSLSEMKGLLVKVIDKIESNEQAIQELNNKLDTRPEMCKRSSTLEPSKTKDIAKTIRQEVRKVYATLESDDENFHGWTTSPGITFKSRPNQEVSNRVIKEVRSLNPSYNATDIRAAAYRFYKSRCEAASLERRGKARDKKLTKRRHERIVRKRREREAAIMKNKKMTQEQKDKWLRVMTNELISSEGSDGEDTVVVHPLPWRSKYVSTMFEKIDQFNCHFKSPQAKRQMKPRRIGAPSLRPCPPQETLPDWAVDATTRQ